MSDRSITPNPPADFNTNVTIPSSLEPFRYWCQKVLPLVYDDSLSYYELLCKVVEYLNKMGDDINTLACDVNGINKAFIKLQQYVNDYFKNLDVQQEINKKLDDMANSGELTLLFGKFYPFVSPKLFHCVGDGVTDDTINFNKMLNYAKENHMVVILNGTYKLSEFIVDDYITIIGNSSKIICDKATISKPITDSNHTIISGVTFDAKNGVLISEGKNIILSNCTVLTDNIGIELSRSNNHLCYENIIENCCIYAKTVGKIGILINTSDCAINNVNMRDFSTALKANYQVLIYNLHSWLSKYEYIPNSVFIECTGSSPSYGETEIIGCCIDTYQTGFKLAKNPAVNITNCRTAFNSTIWSGNAKPLLFSFDYAYAIEYVKLRLSENNFLGFFEKQGKISNIYLYPLLSNNLVDGWSDVLPGGYNLTHFYNVDTTHLPSDYTMSFNQFARFDRVKLSFTVTATFNNGQTQLFWNNTYNNNTTLSVYSTCTVIDETGNISLGELYADAVGVYIKTPLAGKLTISGTLEQLLPWMHTD